MTKQLLTACKNEDIEAVMAMIGTGIDFSSNHNAALKIAVHKYNLPLIKVLLQQETVYNHEATAGFPILKSQLYQSHFWATANRHRAHCAIFMSEKFAELNVSIPENLKSKIHSFEKTYGHSQHDAFDNGSLSQYGGQELKGQKRRIKSLGIKF
jgi:hypothetical protein